jgi:hypothetical protein
VTTFTPATVRISIPDEEEVSFTLTPKGVANNAMTSSTNSSRRRRRPTKRVAPVATAKVTRKSQISKKRVLNGYQNQLVVSPAILISNPFSALYVVAKNSVTSQLRQA